MKKIFLITILISAKSFAKLENGNYICSYQDNDYSETIKLDLDNSGLIVTYDNGEKSQLDYTQEGLKAPLIIDSNQVGYYFILRSENSVIINKDYPAELCTSDDESDCETIEDETLNMDLRNENNKVKMYFDFSRSGELDPTVIFDCEIDSESYNHIGS